MKRFTDLYTALDATTRTGEKERLLVEYFSSTPPEDASIVLAILTGNRPKRAVKTPVLRRAVSEMSGVPPWLVAECYEQVGDFSETIALLLPDDCPAGTDEPLHRFVRERIGAMAGLSEETQVMALRETWSGLSREQKLVFHKLIGGSFRVGVQKKLVVRALATVAGVELAVMDHRLAGGFAPDAEAYETLLRTEDETDNAARPYPFFLAHQLDAPEEGLDAALGDPRVWIAEYKWDGVRAQLIRRAGQTLLWSRGEAIISGQFPELVSIGRSLDDGTVLDGEVLIWRDDSPRPFAELQQRLNRKVAPVVQPGLFDRDEAVLVAFDIIEAGGEDLRSLPLQARREKLIETVERSGDPALRLSEPVRGETWEALAKIRAGARSRGAEGLMLKHRLSLYGVGRRKNPDPADPGWWKWKLDPYSVECVLIYAQAGSGRRSGLYTDYTFGVWSDGPEKPERELVPFAKAYSGLTQEEIEKVDRFVRANTTGRMGPVRQVKPELVFELGFEGIGRSDRHRSGIAVRFPRMLRWRTDKKPEDADTMAALEALLSAQDGGRA
ncbi:MAG: ATP-dependent DNA ligase [Phycisphaerales bacterium]|nr:ATP-dependent DNA ligase [Phycisphaerales bacterium]